MVHSPQVLNLDSILDELGSFSGYQIRNYFLLSIPIVAACVYSVSYVFTALNPIYRCVIPECEDLSFTEYSPIWLENAVPFQNNKPSSCLRYEFLTNHSEKTLHQCPPSWFNRNSEKSCSEYYVKATHTSIAQDFNLYCGERWKLSLVGTIHNIGQFFSMFLTGIISDRFGRRIALTAGLVSSGVLGIIRSFAPSYIWFITFEFLDAAIGSGTFISSFVLITELTNPEKRALISTLAWMAYPIGDAVLVVSAYYIYDWRILLRVIYAPGLIFILYLWCIPESVRWLLSKSRFQEAQNSLNHFAKESGVTLSQLEIGPKKDEKHLDETFTDALRNPIIRCRLIVCSICWLICVFVAYGIALFSVSITGNLYFNFFIVGVMSIPGNILGYVTMTKFGRKWSIFSGYLISGLACLVIILDQTESQWIQLVCFLIAKCTITMTFEILYIYTSELFPTSLRQTCFGGCSTIGRFGSMIAPQMTLLGDVVWIKLPPLLFGVTSIVAALLSLKLPETINIKLPDTLEEASKIGETTV